MEPDFLNTEGTHLHDSAISSISFQHDEPVNIGQLQNWIQDLLDTKGAQMLRYKGVVNVMHMKSRVVFQGVHMLFSGTFMEEWKPDEKRQTKFVFIGKNLDREEIVNGFLACKVEDEALRFDVGTRVLAFRGRGGFKPGVIIALWDEGNPYRIRLDSGMEVRNKLLNMDWLI
jgi:hypothetical protein